MKAVCVCELMNRCDTSILLLLLFSCLYEAIMSFLNLGMLNKVRKFELQCIDLDLNSFFAVFAIRFVIATRWRAFNKPYNHIVHLNSASLRQAAGKVKYSDA